MFQFPPFASLAGYLSKADGLPHSEISGSWTACVYPELFAACHVLHRLQIPRHPPYILLFFLPNFLAQEIKAYIRTDVNGLLLSATVHP